MFHHNHRPKKGRATPLSVAHFFHGVVYVN